MTEQCKQEGCEAPAYHLSTLGGHFFGAPPMEGDSRMLWAEERKYKCERGHISQVGVWLSKLLPEPLRSIYATSGSLT